MIHRLLALLGVVAHAVTRFVGSILGIVGLGAVARFVVPALVVGLVALTALTARDTAAILDSRPEVTQATLAEVAAHDGSGSIWFEFDALVDATSLATPADLGTFFYLARDPENPDRGLLVRSPQNDLFFRTRVIEAALVEDPDLVADALARFGSLPGGLDIDQSRYLDETGAGVPEEAVAPSDVRGLEAGAEGSVAGRVVSPGSFTLCERDGECDGTDDSYLYLFADAAGGSAILLRSPHPPDALPVRLQGLFARDTYDLGPVLASDWFAGIDAEVPTNRAFSSGSQPPITVPASWVPTVIWGALAALLLASLLVGYPVFARAPSPAPRRTLGPGDEVAVLISGRLDSPRSRGTLDRSAGAFQRLGVRDLAMLMWRYGMAGELSRREAEERFADQAGADDRLLINARDQSALVLIERTPGAASAEVGHVHRVGRRTPAVRIRQGATDAILTTRTADDRDRIAAEVAAETAAADVPTGPDPVLGSATST